MGLRPLSRQLSGVLPASPHVHGCPWGQNPHTSDFLRGPSGELRSDEARHSVASSALRVFLG
eukprot:4298382-Alexandrium_andersonii.AAC.1